MKMRWPLTACVIAASMWVSVGCDTGPKRSGPTPTTSVLRVTQHVGGTHYRMVLHDDVWYQTHGSDLLVIEPRSARVLHTVSLGPAGEVGGAIDMVRHSDRLFVVLDDDAVVELSISERRVPRITSMRTTAELGVAARRLSLVDGQLYISGIGGVVRWSDQRRVYSNPGDVSRVVTSNEGLVACVGRRIYRIEDGQFVGSASDLFHADALGYASAVVDSSQLLLFARQSPDGALVGLMGPDLRELDSRDLTIAVPGHVYSVRVFDRRIWIVTDAEILAYQVERGALERVLLIDILGARDVAPTDDNHLAVAGSFGRSLYRIRTSERGAGDSFMHVHREPSRLTHAKTDGRHILAGSEEGTWLYLIGSRVELSKESMDRDGAPPPPATTANTVTSRARLADNGSSLLITGEYGVIEHREPSGARMHSVIAVEGEYWVGHDRGITIVRSRPRVEADQIDVSSDAMVAGSLRIDGPVRYMFPLRVGRGVAYVSEFGGFGTAQWVEEPLDAR